MSTDKFPKVRNRSADEIPISGNESLLSEKLLTGNSKNWHKSADENPKTRNLTATILPFLSLKVH